MGFISDRASQALRFDELEGRFDPWLLCIALALGGLGVVMVASSSMPYAMSNGSGPFYFLIRHLIFLGLGIGMALVLMRIETARRSSSTASCCCWSCASSCWCGVRAGHRQDRQRRAPLAEPGSVQLPGGRSGEADV